MTPRVPPSLVRNLRDRRCVLFAGAGLSAWAGLPTWRRLLEETVEEVRNETLADDRGELDRMIEHGKYLELADHCREQLGPRYTELLSERLRAADGEIPEVHRLVMRMPFAGWVTTNYDKLLERAWAEERGGWPKTLTHMDADSLAMVLFDRVPFILKAHGDIDKPSSIVLTTRDYREIIHANPAFNAVFSAILLTNAVLFVGYSLSDPDFRLLLDRQLTTFRSFVPDRYAIMPDVGDVERDVLWRSSRIKVLTYEGDHAWLLEFLRTLASAAGTAERPTAPAEPGAIAGPRKRGAKAEPEPAGAGRADATRTPSMPAPPAADRADGASCELALSLNARRIHARLTDPGGVILAEHTGPGFDWSWLIRLTSRIHHGHQPLRAESLGEALAAQIPPEVLAALPAATHAHPAPILRLVLDADIEALPWEATAVGDEPLALKTALARAPTTVSDRARGVPSIASPGRALLIGDPDATPTVPPLPGARREVEAIERLLTERGFECTALYGKAATVDAVLAALQSKHHDVVHFAGHAWYDAFEVYLELAGSVRITSAELRPLVARRPPPLVFLASHYTAFLPPGSEPVAAGGHGSPDAVHTTARGRSGFAEDMMRSGVGAFIGCWGSPTDQGAADFASAFYQRLLGGDCVAEAVRRARRTLRDAAHEDATPLLYALYGYGSLKLV